MPASEQIPRAGTDPDGLDFATLRKEGIGRTQDLCGEVWTDYNLHDPGVTILEQLCYGLTDLSYRSGFSVEDYLTNEKDTIDYQQQALFSPEEILPSPAVTEIDYQKILYDAIPEIDYVWFKCAEGASAPNGLYTVFIKLDNELMESYAEECGESDDKQKIQDDEIIEKERIESSVKQKIQEFFASRRNLCEDIDDVKIVPEKPWFLAGEVEIQPSYNKAKIYAEIYLKCSHYITSGIQIERYESIFRQTGNYELIFSGPLTQNGFINDQCFETPDEVMSVVDLTILINQIEGVVRVHDLYLIDDKGEEQSNISYQISEHYFPSLKFPKPAESEHKLQLVIAKEISRKSSEQAVSNRPNRSVEDETLLKEAYLEFKKLIFEYRFLRNNPASFTDLIPLPKGEQQVTAGYYSIQNHFPAAYGINHYGIPGSKPPEVKAKAKQLKAYLFPFEQLMADYLQHVQQMPRLFSLDAGLKQSYFCQFLDNGHIPGIESLYVKDTDETALSKILAHFDRFSDRRSRVLDTLLAMYGEQYPQAALQQFDCYWRVDQDRWIIENKINFLKFIRNVTRDRGKGFNYREPVWQVHGENNEENVAGAHQRISILLGLMPSGRTALITEVLTQRNSRLIPDRIVVDSMPFLPADIAGEKTPLEFDEKKFADVIIPAKLPPFAYTVFKEGAEFKNYRLVSDGKETVVCLKSVSDNRLWPLSRKHDRDAAVRYAHAFCSTLTQLNMACERFHLIEHVLLRPRGKDSFAAIPEGESFFDFRISVIFPSWTTRFFNTAFRKFAEETVVKNLPAHIVAEFYWLDFVYMQDFEQRYQHWLLCLQQAHKTQQPNDLERLSSASERIVSFLLRNRSGAECERWL
ncbi:MAG: hypothetical protein KGN35_00745 [Betaproteobacteria bacterium]|nr:hypothetical protein [Betaproteobacteria bacterium]